MRIEILAFVAVVTLLSPLAHAADVAVVEPEAQQALTVGIGGLWFLESELRPVEDAPTPAWSLRYAYDGGGNVGIEVAWTGNTGMERNQHMRVANMFETGLKFIVAPTAAITPFAAAGMGYAAFFGAPENTDFVVVTMPLAAGLEIRGDDFVIGARATWRQTFADETAYTSMGANHVTAMVELGQRF